MVSPTTPLMHIPVIPESTDPFIDEASAFENGVDAWIQATREDTSLFLVNPGDPWVYDPMSEELSWAAPIVIGSADGGGAVVVAPSTVPLVGSNYVVCVEIPGRPITGMVPGTVFTCASVPRDVKKFVIGVVTSGVFVSRWGGGPVEMPNVEWVHENLLDNTILDDPNGHFYTNQGTLSPVELTVGGPSDETGEQVCRFMRCSSANHMALLPASAILLPDGTVMVAGMSLVAVEDYSFLELTNVERDVWAVTTMSGRWQVYNSTRPGWEFRSRMIPDTALHGARTHETLLPHGGGSGEAAHWTPRIATPLIFGIKGCADVRGCWFPVANIDAGLAMFDTPTDVAAFFPAGRRFAVRDCGDGDTTDKEYIVESAIYNGVTARTEITIRTGASPGYIKTAIPATAVSGGYIYLACLKFGRSGNYRLRAKVSGYGCAGVAAAFQDCSIGSSIAYDATTGATTSTDQRSRSGAGGYSTPATPSGVNAFAETVVTIVDPDTQLWELVQYIENSFDDAGDYQSWGKPLAATETVFATVEIVEDISTPVGA